MPAIGPASELVEYGFRHIVSTKVVTNTLFTSLRMHGDFKAEPVRSCVMGERPTVCVVIPAFNVADWIGEQLEALCRQDWNGTWEVVVSDNGSTDETRAVVERYESRLPLRIVSAGERRGQSHARNVAIASSDADWFVFVDGDDVAGEGLLSAYAANFERWKYMGGHYDEGALNRPDVAAWRYPITGNGLPKAYGLVPFALGGNAALHRSVLEQLGGFDEELGPGEEVDLALRAYRAGIEIGWVPEAVVAYRHRSTLKGLARQQWTYGRTTVRLFDQYRRMIPLTGTTARGTLRMVKAILLHVPDLVRGSVRRGQWIRLTSFVAGEVCESLRRRIWHVG